MKKTLVLIILAGFFYKAPGQELANHTGTIRVARPKKALVAVELEKMNVLYIGVDNPLTILPCNNRTISYVAISDGTVTRSGDSYIVRVTQAPNATLNIYEKLANGNTALLETRVFRVKRIPDPVVIFAGKKSESNITRGEILSAAGLIAQLENFDFDLSIKVVSFDITALVENNTLIRTESSNSNLLTEGQKALLQKAAKPGTRIFIERIKAKMPDGTIRDLAPTQLRVN